MSISADSFNRDCECVGTDLPALHRELDGQFAEPDGGGRRLADTHPHLFSDIPVFIEPAHMRQMQRIVEAVETVVGLPAYRDRVLRNAPSVAAREVHAAGVFLGFDFHIAADGPKLIEINTNAGGALLNIAARGAQIACCPPVSACFKPEQGVAALETDIFSMFEAEWRLARGGRSLHTVAIIDDAPEQQYLRPEFRLFERLFAAHGLRAFIADARELEYVDGLLKYRGQPIDLVYNRLTDFYFGAQAHAALKRAYESDAAVITPHPRAHALYSNKRNLCVLSDADALRAMGVAAAERDTLLQGIPQTVEVLSDATKWWAERKHWFFKPAVGFGSRGAYRGDKLTRGVFAEIMRGGYVAQRLTPPSERWRTTAGEPRGYKLDVRNYVYRGRTQLVAARLYQGQTTNFRTAGGGFAPVYQSPALLCRANTSA